MKRYLSLSALLLVMMSLQGCVAYVYGPGTYGPGWHRWHRGWWDASVTANTNQDSTALLAQNYSVSTASAQTIVNFAQGNNSAQILTSMGVSEADLAPLNTFEIPSQETIQAVATSLGEDPAKIEKIFADFVTDAKADSSDTDAGN